MVKKLLFLILFFGTTLSFAQNNTLNKFDDTNLGVLNDDLSQMSSELNSLKSTTGALPSFPLSTSNGGTGSTAAANGASGVVVLNGSTQLPAVSGALLTNLPTTSTAKVGTYTGNGGSQNVAHGLGSQPNFIMFFNTADGTICGYVRSGATENCQQFSSPQTHPAITTDSTNIIITSVSGEPNYSGRSYIFYAAIAN